MTRAIALANSLPDYLSQVVAGGWLGRSTIDAGKFDRGLAILETYQEVYEERGAVLGGYVYLGNALADAYLTASEEATGEQKVTWLEKAKRVCRKSLKVAKISRTGMPEAMLFQGRYDWLRGRQGRAQKWWMQGIGVAREIGDPFLEAIIYHEIGRRTDDRGRLLQAESILDELGAAGELKAVRGTLRNFRPVAGE